MTEGISRRAEVAIFQEPTGSFEVLAARLGDGEAERSVLVFLLDRDGGAADRDRLAAWERACHARRDIVGRGAGRLWHRLGGSEPRRGVGP